MSEKIRVLFLSANPRDTTRIRVDEEAREIFEKIEEGTGRGAFELFKYPATRVGDLQRLLMKHRPHIVHFSVHGSLAQKIILEGSAGRGRRVDKRALAEVFRVLKDDVRVIVLNACFTKLQAQALTEVIDYTVGSSETIGDRAAVTFAGAFYRALAFGRSVQEAFELGKVELNLKGIRGSKVLELLIRHGTDVTEPLLLRDRSAAGGRRLTGRMLRTVAW